MAGYADVSVIVAAYQAAGTIGRALASVAAQTVKPREVVVADDGSTDGTAAAAEACAAAMNGIRLIVIRSETNMGAGAARNRAIAASSASLLAFLDADDEWLPEKLSRSLAVMKEGNFTLVAHDYLTDGIGGGPPVYHDCRRRFLAGPDPYVQLYRKGYIPSCSVVTRREAVLAAGGFDETLGNAQDFELWLALLKAPGARFDVFGQALLRYHRTPGGIMSHTARRLRCGTAIAVRYFPTLRRRPGSRYISLWYRIAALHMEAVRAYGTQGRIASMLAAGLLLPVGLALATLRCLLGTPRERPAATPDGPAPAALPAGAIAALWVWVIAVMAVYVYQFKALVRPALQLIGLA